MSLPDAYLPAASLLAELQRFTDEDLKIALEQVQTDFEAVLDSDFDAEGFLANRLAHADQDHTK